MKNLVLTGGAGSIGIHVIAHVFHNTDWRITLLDSFRHKGYAQRIIELFSEHPDWYERLTVIETDLVCPINQAMKEGIGQVDYILHLAALSDVFFSVENPVYTIKNNIDSTLTMLEYARECKPEQFIYFSTDEVYGAVEAGDAHPEGDPHKPSNAYSASKAASEDICYAYWRSYGVPLIITNTMNNFGEMQSASKFPVIVQKKLERDETITIHGSPEEAGTRFYIHSRNVADALLHIIEQGAHSHEMGKIDNPKHYHIVGETCLSNMELVEKIAKIMGKNDVKVEYQDFHKDNPGHDIHYGLEDNNLKGSGWKQPLSFKESMKNTIKWQQEHKDWT